MRGFKCASEPQLSLLHRGRGESAESCGPGEYLGGDPSCHCHSLSRETRVRLLILPAFTASWIVWKLTLFTLFIPRHGLAESLYFLIDVIISKHLVIVSLSIILRVE